MLVLTRKKGQQIRIGEGIVLTVLELSNGRARLGFEAPDDVVILRQEIPDEFRMGAPPRKRVRRSQGSRAEALWQNGQGQGKVSPGATRQVSKGEAAHGARK